jgi:hypothetical protein
MAHRINRADRAEISRQARSIRTKGQRAGWPVERIVAEILERLPQVLPLEAWRWAYGWSRDAAIEGIAELYRSDGLAPPALTPAMLCRWEHGAITPSPEYAGALCRLYNVTPTQLRLPSWARHHSPDRRGEYGSWLGGLMAAEDEAGLIALRESVELALEVEGPAGGAQTRENLLATLDYYEMRYGAIPPRVLAVEVHRCRTAVNGMLHHPQSEAVRRDLRRIAGWLSALLGNLAFHLTDQTAAHVHLATAHRLGTDVGDQWLTCWTLGARAMIAYYGDQHETALHYAQQAHELADTPLRQAQMLAWAQLRPTAALGQRAAEVAEISSQALDAMDADPAGDQPGRFGFNRAELHMHLAEAALASGDAAASGRYASQSLEHVPRGGPDWAASQLVLARTQAAQGHDSDAAALAHQVLDTIPPTALRSTSRQRLTRLDTDLRRRNGTTATEVIELRDRLSALPPLTPAHASSAEPNGN